MNVVLGKKDKPSNSPDCGISHQQTVTPSVLPKIKLPVLPLTPDSEPSLKVKYSRRRSQSLSPRKIIYSATPPPRKNTCTDDNDPRKLGIPFTPKILASPITSSFHKIRKNTESKLTKPSPPEEKPIILQDNIPTPKRESAAIVNRDLVSIPPVVGMMVYF